MRADVFMTARPANAGARRLKGLRTSKRDGQRTDGAAGVGEFRLPWARMLSYIFVAELSQHELLGHRSIELDLM